MDRFRLFLEDLDFSKELMNNAFWFLVFGLLSIAGKGMKEHKKLNFSLAIVKLFINIFAGYGLYSLIVWIWNEASQPPLQIFVIMAVVYLGSPIVDILTERLLNFIREVNIGNFIKDLILKFIGK